MNAVTVIKISHNVVLMATRPSQCSWLNLNVWGKFYSSAAWRET